MTSTTITSSTPVVTTTATPKYASKEHIAKVFSHCLAGDWDGFFAWVVPDVHWQVQSKTILGGTYTSRDAFRAATFGRLTQIMDPAHPVRPRVHNIVGGGDDEWAAVEMTNTSKTVTGMDYNNTFCWVTRWNPQGKIVQVRAYLDTALVDSIVQGSEGRNQQ